MYALNGGEILAILKRCPVTSKYFKEVSTRDINIPTNPYLPLKTKGPLANKAPVAAYVLNTGYTRAGIHWVLVLFSSPYNIFFDSFGRSPEKLCLESQAKLRNTSILYNTKKLQHPKSSVCGHWTIYYAYFLCQGQTLSEINSRFSSTNFASNDKIVYNFVKKLAIKCRAPLTRSV